jgi:hypothetical protein
MSDSPLILSALFLLDVAPVGKRATTLGIDIVGELPVEQPKRKPRQMAGL